MTLRNYANIANTVQTLSPVNNTQTSLPVSTTSGYPTPPFLLGLNRGLADEEVCLCTAVIPGTSFTVVRGFDGTTAAAHNPCVIEHTSSAIEFRQANSFINLMTTQGDLLYQTASTTSESGITGPGDSTTAARLPIGTANQLLGVSNGFPAWVNPAISIGRHYSVSGLLAVANGATNYLPPFNLSVPSGQTTTLVKVFAYIRSGTSVTMNINQGHGGTVTTVPNLGGISVTTTPTTFTPTGTINVADNDGFAPVITGTSGNPDGLTLNFFFSVSI